MSKKIGVLNVLKNLLMELKKKKFQIDKAIKNPIRIKYKEIPELVYIFFDDTKIIILIGNERYALSEKQIDAIIMEHNDFFVVSSYGGVKKIIPIDPKNRPNVGEIADKIEKVMALL